MITPFILSLCAGCFVAVMRYVLNDKWNALPKGICHFCLFFWISFAIEIPIALIGLTQSIQYATLILIFGAAVSTVVSNIGYVYIKNANL